MINNYKNIDNVVNDNLVNYKAQEPDKQSFFQSHPYLVNTAISVLTALTISGCTNNGAIAGTKDDIGSKLEKPSVIQRGLGHIKGYFTDKTTIDDFYKEGYRKSRGKGWKEGSKELSKGIGKAAAWIVPSVIRDIAMIPINVPKSLYDNIGKTKERLDKEIWLRGELSTFEKIIAALPTYAGSYIFDVGKDIVKNPVQNAANGTALYIGVKAGLDANKRTRIQLGIDEPRPKDTNAEVVVKKKATDPTGGD